MAIASLLLFITLYIKEFPTKTTRASQSVETTLQLRCQELIVEIFTYLYAVVDWWRGRIVANLIHNNSTKVNIRNVDNEGKRTMCKN